MTDSNKDYVFASSRVRGAEKNLLTREKAEKMADSKSPEEAMKILLDLGYGAEEETENDGEDKVDALLAQELLKTYDFILGIAPDRDDFRTFLYPYDYHNLKVLLKSEFAGIDGSASLIDIGTLGPERLTVMVRERSFTAMSSAMRDAVLEAIDVFSRTKDPQMIDFIFDGACYAEMLAAAEQTGNSFIKNYVKLTIDVINLKTFARVKAMKRPWDFYQRVFLPGGSVPEKLYTAGYDDSWEQLAEKLLPYGLTDAAALGGAAIRETGRFTTLEKLCDDRIMDFAGDAKYVSFGIEPLAAYLIAKEGEIRLARIVLAGLSQGLPREEIAERMRKTYV